MKKIIILILVLIVIIAAYFLFTAKEKPTEEPVVGPAEDSLFPGAEFIVQSLGDYGSYNYYVVEGSLPEIINFYENQFPDFEVEMNSDFGYWRAENYEMSKLQHELWGKTSFETWKELKKGTVLSVFITPHGSPAYENHEFLEEFENKFEGKNLLIIGYL